MADGQSRRSLSPYHEKCFPPYCDNAHQVDKAMVSKMPRGDLEDKYITYADENLELKKQTKNLERQVQRLQTAIQRQDKIDRRAGNTPASMVSDGNRLAILEAQNKSLQSKVKVLKQQLMNHSYIHCKEGRINEAKMRQSLSIEGKTPRESEFSYPCPAPNVPSSTREAKPEKPDKTLEALKKRVAELEKQLETQKNKYKGRIDQLEKELSALEKEAGKSGTSVNEQLSETSRQVKDNKELIKLRMLAEKQAAELDELRDKLKAAEEDVEKLRQELKDAKDRADELEAQLDKERNRSRSAISKVSKGSTHMETIRALEEQIRDLQNERDTLKDTNGKLLLLTQSKSEKSLGLAAKPPSGHSLQISQLEKDLKDKMDEVEEKEARIKELEKQLADAEKALEDSQKTPPRPNTPPPTPAETNGELDLLKDEVDNLKRDLEAVKAQKADLEDQKGKMERELGDAQNELGELRPIAAEHKDCKKTPPSTSKDNLIDDLKKQNQDTQDKLGQAMEEINKLRPIVEDHKNCRKTPLPSTSSKDNLIDDLKKQHQDTKDKLGQAMEEINKLRPIVEDHKNCRKTPLPSISSKLDNMKNENQRLEDELQRASQELRELRPIVQEHKNCKTTQPLPNIASKLDNLKNQNQRIEDELQRALEELRELRPIVQEHKINCNKTPLPSMASKDDLKKQNQKYEDQLRRLLDELNELRPVVEEHNKNCRKSPPQPTTYSKSMQFPIASVVSFKNDPVLEVTPLEVDTSEESVHSKKTIDSERYLALSRQLEEALAENERLKRELDGLDDDDALKKQNQRLSDELSRALQELKDVKPVADEHLKKCLHKTPAPSIHSATTKSRQPSPVQSMLSRAPPRQDYVSHVSPPPSIHCVETVEVGDPAQKANMLIVSKHDFETVLLQKKRYSADVEVVEPVDGRQCLNCKLEICMYDLDVDDRMLEYLQSIQPDPKVYVEWSFVGLDQRTSPLPAQQALFYTNVMYYGPLSQEIKDYLNKVEMPVDLYLVRSSGAPLKIAEGTLDMLPAMEQPNRGFMRSVFLRGRDVPSRYAMDRPAATIHCSFILHECSLGDPPFKDQVEVAIGTLYLKNRDGGIVPDHATHIYVEYALMGHCGPDLETDSVPRGEVMKFNHTKKLRVNEENMPHLRAMLEDNNPKLLRFTVLAEPCSLTTDTEVETVGHADINLNEEMIRKDRDLVSSQVPVFSNEGEHLGSLSVTVLGIGTLKEVYGKQVTA